MTIIEESPAAQPNAQGTTATRYVVNPAEDRASRRFVLAFVLGALAIGMIGFVVLILGAVALSDGSDSAPIQSTLVLSVQEFSITGDLVAQAGNVTLVIKNNGSMTHNVVLRNPVIASPDVGPGGTVELNLGELSPGVYEIYCSIAGHESSGMVNTLTITGTGGDATAADQSGAVHGGMDYEGMDMAMTESMLAFPAETEGRGNPVLEPTEIRADGTKVFDLTAEIVDWEVEPGKFVEAWTYNGVVPAPQFILDRDDKVEIRVVNNLPLGTDIHWHGVHTPNDQDGVAPYTQDLIPPNGGTFTYEFTVDDDAIGMYHAHNHAQLQVVNGMFGVFRVGENPIPYGQTISGVTIPDEIDLAVDMPMTLNDAGTIGLSLNGKSFPATEPLVLNQGEWASITYYNEGLQTHPMHLHQFPQLVYAKDGIPLDQPYYVDTLNIAPGERYTVLMRADDPGTWVWHCHILNHVEREDGMFGMVTAIVVNPDPTFDPSELPIRPSNWRNTAGEPIDRGQLDAMDGMDHDGDGEIDAAGGHDESPSSDEA
ncbi:MAG: FtsP/CotA-like multicopper oxidase with cupredoxin domain [Acidimicrobiales bacterium]